MPETEQNLAETTVNKNFHRVYNFMGRSDCKQINKKYKIWQMLRERITLESVCS